MPTRTQRSRSKSPVEKATFHQITGAGKSRVIRRFFGVDDKTEDKIFKKVETFIVRKLRRATR